MSFLKAWRGFWNRPNPHFRKVDEFSRVTSPSGKLDAVLEHDSGSNFKLYVVQAGKGVIGQAHEFVFVHVADRRIQIEWEDAATVRCEFECERVIGRDGGEVDGRSGGLLLFVST